MTNLVMTFIFFLDVCVWGKGGNIQYFDCHVKFISGLQDKMMRDQTGQRGFVTRLLFCQ